MEGRAGFAQRASEDGSPKAGNGSLQRHEDFVCIAFRYLLVDNSCYLPCLIFYATVCCGSCSSYCVFSIRISSVVAPKGITVTLKVLKV